MPKFRLVCSLLLAASGALTAVAAPALAVGRDDPPPTAVSSLPDWSALVWRSAAKGDEQTLLTLLDRAPLDAADGAAERLVRSVDLLEANFAKREATRAEKIAEVSADLDKALAEGGADLSLSKALKSAIELHMLSTDKAAVLADPRITKLVKDAEAAAKAAEARGDWFTSNELFLRLASLMDESGAYKEDVRRGAQRLAIIRLYAPKRFWELRNQRRIAEGEPPLPEYNPTGDDFHKKLDGINSRLVIRALSRAAEHHVEGIGYREMLLGGLEGVRTLISTRDLQEAFPGVKDDRAAARLAEFLDQYKAKYAKPDGGYGYGDLNILMSKLIEANAATVKIDETALLHEFANGAMGALDEHSVIIWPDEIRRFNRTTQARFVGVGIQIQLDEMQNIKVVTPLEGTPAQRAGIRANDLIKKIDGQPTVGMSLDQAVDVITGPEDSEVVLTIEREVVGEEKPVEIDFPLVRTEIPLYTVKGWRKLSPKEDDWDWFIDPEHKIGYIRLTQFSETTDKEFDRAVAQMKAKGLNGVILDLRFNGGGLLEQAVAIASRFVDGRTASHYDGVVVSTGTLKGPQRTEKAQNNRASLAGIPVAVLINEGAASASEIVSGAIQDYAQVGDVRALLVGQRTYGKGSVQNVWALTPAQDSALKLTTQYYRLPGKRLIHRKPGATEWGVEPDLKIEMLPEQVANAFKLRQDADIFRLNEQGEVLTDDEAMPDPMALITEGTDLQLQTALVVLQSQTLPAVAGRAHLDAPIGAHSEKN